MTVRSTELSINGITVGVWSPMVPDLLAPRVSFVTTDEFAYTCIVDKLETEISLGNEYNSPTDPLYPFFRFVARVVEPIGPILPELGDYESYRLIAEIVVDEQYYLGRHEFRFVPANIKNYQRS